MDTGWQRIRSPVFANKKRKKERYLIIVGLTGGIASGKSTVAAFLSEAGAIIIDADQIAREVVNPGMPAWKDVCAVFGKDILATNGYIDRERLGRVVFENADLRRKLEQIIHPRISEQMDARLRQIAESSPDAVVVMDIPLLFETGKTEGFAEIIVVYTTAKIQKDRLLQRNRLDIREAQVRIASQMPLSEKVKMGTITIDNSGSVEETRKQTLAIYQRLNQRAKTAPNGANIK